METGWYSPRRSWAKGETRTDAAQHAADALHDRQFTVLPYRHQGLKRRMQSRARIELQHLLARNGYARTQVVVIRIGERDDGVEAVVAALQFDEDQEVVIAPRCGRTRTRIPTAPAI